MALVGILLAATASASTSAPAGASGMVVVDASYHKVAEGDVLVETWRTEDGGCATEGVVFTGSSSSSDPTGFVTVVPTETCAFVVVEKAAAEAAVALADDARKQLPSVGLTMTGPTTGGTKGDPEVSQHTRAAESMVWEGAVGDVANALRTDFAWYEDGMYAYSGAGSHACSSSAARGWTTTMCNGSRRGADTWVEYGSAMTSCGPRSACTDHDHAIRGHGSGASECSWTISGWAEHGYRAGCTPG